MQMSIYDQIINGAKVNLPVPSNFGEEDQVELIAINVITAPYNQIIPFLNWNVQSNLSFFVKNQVNQQIDLPLDNYKKLKMPNSKRYFTDSSKPRDSLNFEHSFKDSKTIDRNISCWIPGNSTIVESKKELPRKWERVSKSILIKRQLEELKDELESSKDVGMTNKFSNIEEEINTLWTPNDDVETSANNLRLDLVRKTIFRAFRRYYIKEAKKAGVISQDIMSKNGRVNHSKLLSKTYNCKTIFDTFASNDTHYYLISLIDKKGKYTNKLSLMRYLEQSTSLRGPELEAKATKFVNLQKKISRLTRWYNIVKAEEVFKIPEYSKMALKFLRNTDIIEEEILSKRQKDEKKKFLQCITDLRFQWESVLASHSLLDKK